MEHRTKRGLWFPEKNIASCLACTVKLTHGTHARWAGGGRARKASDLGFHSFRLFQAGRLNFQPENLGCKKTDSVHKILFGWAGPGKNAGHCHPFALSHGPEKNFTLTLRKRNSATSLSYI
jgi:hypothetical protein